MDEEKPPDTIPDDRWERIRNGFAAAIPMIDGPWAEPDRASRKDNWRAASREAASN